MSDELTSQRWGRAIWRWQTGDRDPVRAMLRELPAIPEFARAFLDDLATETAGHTRGAPHLRAASDERDLLDEVFMEWDALEASGESASREVAIANVAERMQELLSRGRNALDKEDVLRGIVEAHERAGYTRELWVRSMRPKPRK